jgi:putative oxidoreductase
MREGHNNWTSAAPSAGDWRGRMGPALHALLRMGAALLFMQHGAQKLLGWFGGLGESGGTAPLMSLMGLAGVLELVGGALLLLGLGTRVIAFLLTGMMAVAYFKAHAPQGAVPVQNQGELALLYMLVFAFLFGNGAGPWSLDNLLARRRTEPPRRTRVEPLPEAQPRRRDTAA